VVKQAQDPARTGGDLEDSVLGYIPAHNDRPNSGLREGDISHAEVNDAISLVSRTVIFGQQTRLRLGLLMEDDTLPRFHAGHDLVVPLVVAHARGQLERYRDLTDQEGGDWRHFLRDFVFQLIGACKPYISDAEKELMLTTSGYCTLGQEVSAGVEVADALLPDAEAEGEKVTLVRILSELRRHPNYHGMFLEQARELAAKAGLNFGDDRRSQLAKLAELIPEPSYRFSSEPQAVRRRADDLQRLRRDDPDSVEQVPLQAGIFVRLDGAPNYADLVDQVRGMGVSVVPIMQEIVSSFGERDSRRAIIRHNAVDLLAEMQRGSS